MKKVHSEILRLDRKDPGGRFRVLGEYLSTLSPNEHLALHEDLVSGALGRMSRYAIDPLLAAQYDLDGRIVGNCRTAMERFERLRSNLIGFHAYAILYGLPPLGSADAPSLGSEPYSYAFDDAEAAWRGGNIGMEVLDDMIPTAYESSAGILWPRTIRARVSTNLLSLVRDSLSGGYGKHSKSGRMYWLAMETLIDHVNRSDAWWDWIRSTEFRTIEVLAHPAVSAGPSVTSSSRASIRRRMAGRKVLLDVRPKLTASDVDNGAIDGLARNDLLAALGKLALDEIPRLPEVSEISSAH